MFTGIVREVGRVVDVEAVNAGATLWIAAPETAARTAVGDSVAIGGVCLTAESVEGETMRFHAVPETLSRSNLGGLQAGDGFNVEPALRAGEPLGGHIVQGHVDGLGSVRAVEQEGDGVRVSFDAPPELLGYLVEKGSVTVDGVGRVQSVEAEGEGLRVFVEAPDDILRFCVEKGSVTAVIGVIVTSGRRAARRTSRARRPRD